MIAVVREMYGYNWASVGGAREAMDTSRAVVAGDFTAKMSEQIGGRDVDLQGLREFADALESDFRLFAYETEAVTVTAPDRVLVTGTIRAVGRASGVPLTSEFGHVWTLRDGAPARVRAWFDVDAATQAAAEGR